MYVWKNNKIKSQYDIQVMTAKNRNVTPFTTEELSVTDLKSKEFTMISDQKIKRLVELAYIRGRMDGLLTADQQIEEIPFSKQASAAILKQPSVAPVIMPEQLFFVACKVKNRQDKILYTGLAIKARSEEEAKSCAQTESGMKNQTLLTCKVVRSYGSDTMQFQFGIGTKEEASLLELGKKTLRSLSS